MLTPDILLKLHEAIPSIGAVYEELRAVEKSWVKEATLRDTKIAADALWHWPELVEAAVRLHELTKNGRYHSISISPPKDSPCPMTPLSPPTP